MTSILAQLLSILPALIGIRAGVVISRRRNGRQGLGLVYAGVGGVLAYPILSFIIWTADQMQLIALNSYLILILAAALGVVFWSSKRPDGPKMQVRAANVWALAPLLLSLILLALFMFSQAMLPMFGWDAVDHWGVQSVRFLHHTYNLGESSTPFTVDKHPVTIEFVLAWHSWISNVLLGQHIVAHPWLILQACGGLICLGAALIMTESWGVAWMAVAIFVTSPLQETHSLVYGYAENFVALSLLASVSLITIGLLVRDWINVVAGLAIGSVAYFLKNVGLAYSLIPFTGLCIYYLLSMNRRFQLSIMTILTTVFFILFTSGFTLPLSPPISWEPDRGLFWFAGRDYGMELRGFGDLLGIELHSRVLNLSFSTSICIFLLGLWSWGFMRQARSSIMFPVICQLIGLVLLNASLFTDYGFKYAVPDNDTGHSRFSIAIFSLTPLTMAALFALVNRGDAVSNEDQVTAASPKQR